METPKHQCPYCNSNAQLSVLRCCLGLICPACYDTQLQANSHDCPSSENFSLISEPNPTTREDPCIRCGDSPAAIMCFNCQNKKFCASCYEQIHSRPKLATHKSVQIQVSSNHLGELECPKHHKLRNLVLENGSLGCVKCSEELKLRKVSIVEDKENFISQANEVSVLLSSKENELKVCVEMATAKWDVINQQLQQEFQQAKATLMQREKQSIEAANLMMKQEINLLQELDNLYSFCRRTLDAYLTLEPSSPQLRRLGRLKRALVSEQIKKGEKRKLTLDNYEYKKTKPNFEALTSLIKTLGIVEKQKIIRQQDKQYLNRSTNKLKCIPLYENRFDNTSNRKRSKSKDVMNTSNISNCRQNKVSLHQRVKSTNRFEGGSDQKRGLSKLPHNPSRFARERSTIERNSVNIESTEYISNLNVNLFNNPNPVPQTNTTSTSSNNISNYATPVTSQTSTGNLAPEIKSVHAQKFKNQFLHLRESIKKNSSYFNQHRPSILRK